MLFVGLISVIDAAFSRVLDTARPPDYQAFIDSKLEYAEASEATDLLVLGDSHTADAFVPQALEQATGLRSYNFGVYHMSPIEGRYLIRDLRQRSPRLKVVVIGTNPVMFTRPPGAGKYTPMFIQNPLIFLSLLLEVRSNNFGLLSRAGKKLDLIGPLISRTLGKAAKSATRQIESSDRGYLVNTRCATRRDVQPDLKRHAEPAIAAQVSHFEQTIRWLQREGLRVIVVHPPLIERYYAIARTTRAYREFDAAVNRIARKANVPVLGTDNSYGVSFGYADFLDGQHLCKPGAQKFSQWLGPELRTLLRAHADVDH